MSVVTDASIRASLLMDGCIEYPFPLSDGSIASLRLPLGLTADDAARLASFVESLAASSVSENKDRQR